jgi:GT2 family glycosyltransferase
MTDTANADVAVVIVNYRTPELTKRCLAALLDERDLLPALRAVVVDGGSGEGSAEELAQAVAHPDYESWVSFLPLTINGGFGWANNQAILSLAREPSPPAYIHLLNPDTEVAKGGVARLMKELIAHPKCAAAGSRLLAPDGRTVPSAFRFPSVGREFVGAAQSESLGRLIGVAPTVVKATESANVDWVTGASVMFRSEALCDVGLFDDGFFLYFEEVELMHRLVSRCWAVRHVPESQVVHLEGASTGAGAASTLPMPAYWYQSRHRYFALTGGLGATYAADLAWLLGRGIAVLKDIVGRSRGESRVRARRLFAGRSRAQPSVPAWGDAPGKLPAWMAPQ